MDYRKEIKCPECEKIHAAPRPWVSTRVEAMFFLFLSIVSVIFVVGVALGFFSTEAQREAFIFAFLLGGSASIGIVSSFLFHRVVKEK